MDVAVTRLSSRRFSRRQCYLPTAVMPRRHPTSNPLEPQGGGKILQCNACRAGGRRAQVKVQLLHPQRARPAQLPKEEGLVRFAAHTSGADVPYSCTATSSLLKS